MEKRREMKKQLKLGKLLIDSIKSLKEIEEKIKKEILNLNISEEIEVRIDSSKFKESFKKNFFTLLMISFLLECKIEKEKVISYGKIIIFLRQIITSTDNVIDNEEKGIIFVKKIKNKVVKNSLIILICQDLLTKECLKLSEDRSISIKVLEKIYKVAESESLRDIEQYKNYPQKEEIIERIHSGIGGELLKFALEVPNLIEKNGKLLGFGKGIYKIGISLQGLDDFFDLDEDEKSGKVNLLKSEILYSKNQSLEKIKENYLKNMINIAYEGFQELEFYGYPIDKKNSKRILKKIFELRGLKEYIKILND